MTVNPVFDAPLLHSLYKSLKAKYSIIFCEQFGDLWLVVEEIAKLPGKLNKPTFILMRRIRLVMTGLISNTYRIDIVRLSV